MRVVLIHNSASGGRYTLTKLRRLCRKNDITISYSFTVRQLGSPKLAKLAKQGVTVMAVGGDGTMNSVARLLVGTPSYLLPLPGGTLNHFVRDLGMTGSVEELIGHIEKAERNVIDVAYVNDELFLNNSSLGLYPFSLLDRKSNSKRVIKWVVAAYASVRQLVTFRRHRLIIDGRKLRSPFVFIGNNLYDITSSLMPQRKTLNEGMLTVMIATSRSRWHLVRAGFNIARGRVAHLDDFSLDSRKSVEIYTHATALPVSYDGEVKYLSPPFLYRIQSSCLKVLVIK